MPKKRNAPALAKREGVVCQFPADTDAYATIQARIQYLGRFGIPSQLAVALAPLAFGEGLS